MSFLLPPIDTWAQWSSAFNDARLWRPVVDAICPREGIAYQRIGARESNTNAVFILDRSVVIKIYSPFWAEFAFERVLMELLARDAAIPVPAIRSAGVLPDGGIGATSRWNSAPDLLSMHCSRRSRGHPCWTWLHKSGACTGICTQSTRRLSPPSTRLSNGTNGIFPTIIPAPSQKEI